MRGNPGIPLSGSVNSRACLTRKFGSDNDFTFVSNDKVCAGVAHTWGSGALAEAMSSHIWGF